MSSVKVNITGSMLKRVEELSKKDKISIEHFIELAVTEKVSALSALDYLKKRAHRGSIEKLDKILSKVPSREPLNFDRI